jgi:uncharacterized RDD family membrane protein YckC
MVQPAQTDPTTVIGRRVLAALIDAALVLVPLIALVTASLEYLPESRLDRPAEEFCDDFMDDGGSRLCFDMTDVDDRVYFTEGVSGAVTAGFWLIPPILFVLLQGLTGWTPGKLVSGIRVVRDDGRPPGMLKALVRWLLWVVDGFPYFLPLVGFITALTTVGHRRVGDMAASTYVVRSSAAGRPVVVPGLTAPAPPQGYASGVPWATTAPAPAADVGWGAPPSPTPPPAPPGPQWDEARGTYIQWDPAQGAWLQWDEPTQAWIRIPGQ